MYTDPHDDGLFGGRFLFQCLTLSTATDGRESHQLPVATGFSVLSEITQALMVTENQGRVTFKSHPLSQFEKESIFSIYRNIAD